MKFPPNTYLRDANGKIMRRDEVLNHIFCTDQWYPRIPMDMERMTQIGNVWVTVLSSKRAKMENPTSNRPHRLIARCPACDKEVSVGRFHQHVEIHKEK